jgi:hypothetical protein
MEIYHNKMLTLHPLILNKLRWCIWGKETIIITSIKQLNNIRDTSNVTEAHIALRLLSFIQNWILEFSKLTLIERCSIDESSTSTTKNHYNIEMFLKREGQCMLERLTRIYVRRATPDTLKMAQNIAAYVINSPNQSVRTSEDGMVTSIGPADLIHMMTQYVEHASKVKELFSFHASVLSMITSPVLKYLHAVELRVAQVRHLLKSDHPGESLLFLCVVVNDCETLAAAIVSFMYSVDVVVWWCGGVVVWWWLFLMFWSENMFHIINIEI